MWLLGTGISMDVAALPYSHLVTIVLFLSVVVVAVVVAVLINGFSIKLGEKEVNVGGIRQLLAKKDEDTLLQQSLKNFADEVDHQATADIFDLVDEIDVCVEKILVNRHCYFTVERFYDLIKRELSKRVRRNSLRERLSEETMDAYINKVLKDIQEKYDFFQERVKTADCDDAYADFSMIRGAVRDELAAFYSGAKAKLVAAMKKKIKRYNEDIPKFKTEPARRFSCIEPIERNRRYIKELTGEDYKGD